MLRAELQGVLDELLDCGRFNDYCPNGLQVEGRPRIQRVLCGVTASQALVEAAIERNADAIIVHHGWFWRGEEVRLTGWRRQRMARLLAHDINLFGFHLPLDAHPELGNNAQLARVLGWQFDECCATQPLVMLGHLPQVETAAGVARSVAARLAREPLLVGDETRRIQRVGWCTGGAQGYFEHAINAGVDLFLSGEISEQTTHLARETGIPFIAAGHHATERYGIRALADWLTREAGLDASFLDLDNPV
jgi:dinuclear metal center YbgI/SA1388 family protein